MARARNIKPGFFKNYDLADQGPLCQLLFAGLWCLADREGRLEDKPRLIKAEIFPYYEVDVNGELTKLERLGFVRRYTVRGMKLIAVQGFKKHQTPHHTEKVSDLPSEEEVDPAEPLPASDPYFNGEVTVNSRNDNGGNPPDSLIPDSLIPDSLIPDSLIPDSLIPDSDSPPVRRSRLAKKTASAPETGELWESYATAYQRRYNAAPVRNAKVNGQIAQLLKRLGKEEAPGVAAWYVSSNNRYYVQKRHAVDCLLADAEGLRTEWATNTRITETRAREADRLQTSGDMWTRIIEEAEAENGER